MVAVVAEKQADDVMLTLAGDGETVTRLGRIIERPAKAQVVYRKRLRFD
jgi:phosphoribosylaminoimidazole (AIR) synthetase